MKWKSIIKLAVSSFVLGTLFVACKWFSILPQPSVLDFVQHHPDLAMTRPSPTVSLQNGTLERPSRRLLFMVATYSFDQYLSLQRTMDCMRDICNAGWDVTVHLQVSPKGLQEDSPEWNILKDRMFCVRTQMHVPIILDHYEAIGFGLNSKHRAFAAAHLGDFDFISYAEEDMLLTVSHLHAYIAGMALLRKHFRDSWMRYQIGFLRYEDSAVGSVDRVTWEYMPHQIHVVDLGNELGKYIFTNNINQALYIFSVEQLRYLEDRCEFLSKPGQNAFYRELRRAQNLEWKYLSVGVSEWSSSFQQVLQCGLRRIVPAQHFQLYMINHSTNKAQKRRLRKELLTMHNWTTLVKEKSEHPISLDEAHGHILREQYNLHLMDTARIEGKAKWAWD